MQLNLQDDVTVAVRPYEGSDEVFEQICRDHPDLRVEQRSSGEILIMSPAGNESSYRNLGILRQLANWTASNDVGLAFDSNTVFALPDGSKLGPDAAWISKRKLSAYSLSERKKFLPVAPELVIELMSATDRIAELKEKMEVWIQNGVELGWLIDADNRKVWIYRAGSDTEELTAPTSLSGTGPVVGFVLEMAEIYQGLNF
jgi:Uma2 family endonuclease